MQGEIKFKQKLDSGRLWKAENFKMIQSAEVKVTKVIVQPI